MSRGFWLTERQKEQLIPGSRFTEKITNYIKTWEERCYSDGIPDEVTDRLMKSGRVPSYKAIAIAILKNDVSLKSLNCNAKYSKWYREFKRKPDKQLKLW